MALLFSSRSLAAAPRQVARPVCTKARMHLGCRQLTCRAGPETVSTGSATGKVRDLEQQLLQNRLVNATTPVPKVPIEFVKATPPPADGSVPGLSDEQPTAVCGPPNFVAVDTRVITTYPYYAMCKLYMTWIDDAGTNWRYIGSAFAINKDTVVTAAHCLFDYDKRSWPNNGWADAVEVFPAMSGYKTSLVGTPRNATKYAAFEGWTNEQYPASLPWDGAVFKVDGDLGLPGYIGLEKGPSAAKGSMIDVMLLGYPGCRQGGEYPFATLDKMEVALDDGNVYEHTVDICGGNSGGPALRRGSGNAFAINVAERLRINENGSRVSVCPNTSVALDYNIKIETLLELLA